MESHESENPEVTHVVLTFARALAEGRFENAYEMLAPSLRDDFQPLDLQTHYYEMTSYWSDPADPLSDQDIHPLVSEWPDKEENDICWTCVSIRSGCGRLSWHHAADAQ
jgi:hypothetical protein